jgi:hypothetical protein
MVERPAAADPAESGVAAPPASTARNQFGERTSVIEQEGPGWRWSCQMLRVR